MATATAKKDDKMGMQAMMEMYRKLGTPGAPHKFLAKMEGSWNAKTKIWPEHGKPPIESSGTSEQKMLFGGRFLQQEFTGEMMGSPFTGIGITGYDNGSNKYVSTWMDSTGTGILYFEGTAGTDGKTFTQENRHNDPVRGPMTYRSVTRIVDEDTHVFEMYSTIAKGKEEKTMEITYTRKR